tara:strand:- start:36736 stop:37080 length:345 start_codon:yes stop_codon:yes gene_type:complete
LTLKNIKISIYRIVRTGLKNLIAPIIQPLHIYRKGEVSIDFWILSLIAGIQVFICFEGMEIMLSHKVRIEKKPFSNLSNSLFPYVCGPGSTGECLAQYSNPRYEVIREQLYKES